MTKELMVIPKVPALQREDWPARQVKYAVLEGEIDGYFSRHREELDKERELEEKNSKERQSDFEFSEAKKKAFKEVIFLCGISMICLPLFWVLDIFDFVSPQISSLNHILLVLYTAFSAIGIVRRFNKVHNKVSCEGIKPIYCDACGQECTVKRIGTHYYKGNPIGEYNFRCPTRISIYREHENMDISSNDYLFPGWY